MLPDAVYAPVIPQRLAASSIVSLHDSKVNYHHDVLRFVFLRLLRRHSPSIPRSKSRQNAVGGHHSIVASNPLSEREDSGMVKAEIERMDFLQLDSSSKREFEWARRKS